MVLIALVGHHPAGKPEWSIPHNAALERLVAQKFGPKAQQIIHLLHATPGLNIDELASSLGIRRTAANHHVRILERAGAIVRVRQARHQLHFAGDTTPFERDTLCAMRVPSVKDVASLLFQGHPPSSAALAAELGITTRTARRALRLLSSRGLLRIEGFGMGRRLGHLHPRLRILLARQEGLAAAPPAAQDDQSLPGTPP